MFHLSDLLQVYKKETMIFKWVGFYNLYGCIHGSHWWEFAGKKRIKISPASLSLCALQFVAAEWRPMKCIPGYVLNDVGCDVWKQNAKMQNLQRSVSGFYLSELNRNHENKSVAYFRWTAENRTEQQRLMVQTRIMPLSFKQDMLKVAQPANFSSFMAPPKKVPLSGLFWFEFGLHPFPWKLHREFGCIGELGSNWFLQCTKNPTYTTKSWTVHSTWHQQTWQSQTPVFKQETRP